MSRSEGRRLAMRHWSIDAYELSLAAKKLERATTEPARREKRRESAKRWRLRQREIDRNARDRGLRVFQYIVSDASPHLTGLTIHRFRVDDKGQAVAICVSYGHPFHRSEKRRVPLASIRTSGEPAPSGPLPHYTVKDYATAHLAGGLYTEPKEWRDDDRR